MDTSRTATTFFHSSRADRSPASAHRLDRCAVDDIAAFHDRLILGKGNEYWYDRRPC